MCTVHYVHTQMCTSATTHTVPHTLSPLRIPGDVCPTVGPLKFLSLPFPPFPARTQSLSLLLACAIKATPQFGSRYTMLLLLRVNPWASEMDEREWRGGRERERERERERSRKAFCTSFTTPRPGKVHGDSCFRRREGEKDYTHISLSFLKVPLSEFNRVAHRRALEK